MSPRTPRLLQLMGAVAVSAALAGCVGSTAGASDSPSPAPTIGPTRPAPAPTSFYLRTWQSQALAPQYTFSWLPGTTISDGKYIDGHVAVPAIFPGPLWIDPSVQTITPTGIATILAEARTLGLLGDTGNFGEVLPGGIAAHVELIVDGKTYELTGSPNATGNPDPGTAAAFMAFYQKLDGLEAWIPDQLGVSNQYEPTRVAVLAMPPTKDTSGITPNQVDWPLDTPFAGFGTATGNQANRCGVVEGADLGKLLPLIRQSNSLTRFKDSAGTVDSIQVHVLVPGEPSPCG